jgi:hypothetical protein
MVDFRRWILALAVLALFTGLASAQVGTGTGANAQFTCAASVTAVPQLRAEGMTETTGDIIITCIGGNPVPAGSQIPIVNISVFLNTQVTSRLVSGSPTGGPGVSEALLMIDEPGSTNTPLVTGFGPQAPQRVCGVAGTFFGANAGGLGGTVGSSSGVLGSPATGCTEFATQTTTIAGAPITVETDTFQGVGTVAAPTPGANVFQGIVNPDSIHNNLVTFFGVPVLPPATTGTSRVFRITNIRANASVFSGSVTVTQQIIAQIAVSNPSALPITNSIPVVGLVQSGLSTSSSGPANLSQCTAATNSSISLLTFKENFATAFKTRVAAATNGGFAGQGVPTTTAPGNQNVPGSIYNSESNFVLPIGSFTAGLADFGTRLKATFLAVPPGVHIFVSVANVLNSVTPAPVVPVPGGSVGNSVATGLALMVPSETATDGTTNGSFQSVSASTTINGIGVVEAVADATGRATAVWEVVNTSPSSLDTLSFAVFTTFAANAAPANTAATVNMSFAPSPPSISATTGVLSSGSLTIPRFVDLSVAKAILNVNICRTVLLFPFVTNQAGFDTGIAIANTSTDPFGTTPQSGTCTLNWFSGANSPPPVTSPIIGPLGVAPNQSVYTALLSSPTIAPGFQGYMIATCNFQFAHGFAFISDIGAQKLAEGYLALVIPDPAGGRFANGLDKAATGTGENIAH